MQRDSRSNSQPHAFHRAPGGHPSPTSLLHHIAHPTPPLHPVAYHPTTHSSSTPHQQHSHPLSSAPSHSVFLFPPSSSFPTHHLTTEPLPSEYVRRSPVTPQRSPVQPVPRLSMAPPAVNYSDSYTFPPTSSSLTSSSLLSSQSSAASSTSSHLASSMQSPSSARHYDTAASPRQSSYTPILLSPSQLPADRLDSLRPDALTLPKSTTSPLGGISHSISLPVLPPPAHAHTLSSASAAGALFGTPVSDTDCRVLDSSIAVLSMMLHASQAGELSGERMQKHLTLVIDQLAGLKTSTHFRSTSLHNALFQTLALRRSTSDTMADQEVVDWISHEYLTPRRGSTSSEGGVTLPLSHSLPSTAHHTHSLSHSHSFLHPHPHSMRSNSMSGVTLRSGSHPSLDALPSTSELGRGGRLVRAANLIRIIKRLSTSTKLRRKHRLEEVKEMGPAIERNGGEGKENSEEKMDFYPNTATSATSPLPPHTVRRKSHLDLPTSTSPIVYPSIATVSASIPAGGMYAASVRSPSSQRRSLPSPIAASPSSKRSVSSRSQQQLASNSSPQLQPSPPSARKPPKLRSPSSSSPSPYTSSPSSQSRNLSRSHSSSSTTTPTSTSRSSSLAAGPLYYAIVDRMVSDPVHTMLAGLSDWNFDIFGFHSMAGQRTLSCICAYLFDELGIFEQFQVRRETFASFITAIEDGYHTDVEVPFHNNIHAADVVLNTYFLLQTPTLQSSFTPLDCFAAVVAAAVHDYAHPGTNNAYQIAMGSEWAIRYNDICVLENMHCSEAFFILRKPDCNIFENLSPAARHEIRSTVIHQVLATDMQQHFKNLAELKNEADRRRLRMMAAPIHHEQPPHASSSSDRLILLANMLHSADLANPCKPLQTYLRWTERVTKEFYNQGDKEREQGLPVSLMMDRAKPNLERSQLGFIDVIVQPLWATLSEIAGSDVNVCLRHLQTNRQYWLDRLPPATPRTRSRQGHSSQNSTGGVTSSSMEQQPQQTLAVHEAPITKYVVPMS